jgi:hypothetical protein
MLLFHYYRHYKTVATDKPLRTSLFPGAAELITHLLRLTYILWLPLCRINKFGFYFTRRLLRSRILVGHQLLRLQLRRLRIAMLRGSSSHTRTNYRQHSGARHQLAPECGKSPSRPAISSTSATRRYQQRLAGSTTTSPLILIVILR